MKQLISQYEQYYAFDEDSLQSSSEIASSGSTTPFSPRQRQKTDRSSDLLDRFSADIVAGLQGSRDLPDAQSRARKLLAEFQLELGGEADEKKYLNASKVLGRALNIMKQKLIDSQSTSRDEIAELERKLMQMEERAKAAEHTSAVLRWHLGQDAGRGVSSGFKTPPDIF